MKLSIELYVLREKFDDFKGIEMIKKAGFDAVDYSFYRFGEEKKRDLVLGDNYKTYAESVRKALDEAGLSCNQAHAPFEIGEDDEYDMSNEKYRRLVRALESASILGAENIVVHAVSLEMDENIKFYKSLEPYCKKFGIRIAVENLFHRSGNGFISRLGTPDELNEIIDRLSSEWFTICIDVGHAQLTYGSPENFIKSANSKKLKALHIQDNNLTDDDHLIPYIGKLNWNAIIESLKNSGYTGDITLEVVKFLNHFDSEETLQSALNLANSIGRDLIKKLKA